VIQNRHRVFVIELESNVILISIRYKKGSQKLVQETIAYSWSPEELKFHHPYLSMGQIYSALAYHADHQDELRQDIDQRLAKADEIHQRIGVKLTPSPKGSQ